MSQARKEFFYAKINFKKLNKTIDFLSGCFIIIVTITN